MKILMTGAAGYVGSACLRWMIRQGHEPIAYDNLLEGKKAAVPEGRLVVGDILDVEALTQAMREHQIEAVMHFAALASVPDSIAQPERYWRVNVLGTKNVLDAMQAAGVDRILFSSTAATYSFDVEMPITEDSPQIPQTPYGTTKLSAEFMIKDYCRANNWGCTLLRYFNAAGADPDGQFGEDHSKETHLIPLILQAAVGKRDKVMLFGDQWDTRDGTCVRDFVHTEDLAQAHQRAIEALQPGETRIYNIGSGTGTTVLEVLRTCEEVAGRAIPYEVAPPRPGDPAVLVASPQRLIDELGWEPHYPGIRDIVETAWRWHSTHPDGYATTSTRV
ncbi:MAG: UDP-glucose 4-epimerase GalE [Phycisphaeraceae bacterium]